MARGAPAQKQIWSFFKCDVAMRRFAHRGKRLSTGKGAYCCWLFCLSIVWVQCSFEDMHGAPDTSPDLSSFDTIDADDDGFVSRQEVQKTGLPPCLKKIVVNTFNDINVDSDDDDLLSEYEWYTFFSARLGRLVTVSEVADWISYAVQKPQYAQRFRSASVSGLDFIDLVRNGGQLLYDELKITNLTARNHIRRQMIRVLCYMEPLPQAPNLRLATISTIGAELSWSVEPAGVVWHQLQRAQDVGQFVDLTDGLSENSYLDSLGGTDSSYRVQAWSSYGRSGWSNVVCLEEQVLTSPPEARWVWGASTRGQSSISFPTFFSTPTVTIVLLLFAAARIWGNSQQRNNEAARGTQDDSGAAVAATVQQPTVPVVESPGISSGLPTSRNSMAKTSGTQGATASDASNTLLRQRSSTALASQNAGLGTTNKSDGLSSSIRPNSGSSVRRTWQGERRRSSQNAFQTFDNVVDYMRDRFGSGLVNG